jgi:hypothetical protein
MQWLRRLHLWNQSWIGIVGPDDRLVLQRKNIAGPVASPWIRRVYATANRAPSGVRLPGPSPQYPAWQGIPTGQPNFFRCRTRLSGENRLIQITQAAPGYKDIPLARVGCSSSLGSPRRWSAPAGPISSTPPSPLPAWSSTTRPAQPSTPPGGRSLEGPRGSEARSRRGLSGHSEECDNRGSTEELMSRVGMDRSVYLEATWKPITSPSMTGHC